MNKKNLINMRTISPCLIAGMLIVTISNTHAALATYTSEAAYKAALTAGGYGELQEDFEKDVVWADSRSTISNPASTPQVNSQGILWTSNFTTNDIATSDVGVAGSFGLYSSPHGDPDVEVSDIVCDVPDPIPEQCFLHDGFVGNSDGAGTLYGVGGWINGTFGAEVTLILDGVEAGFGADGSIDSWTFFGVIDTAGFNSFEFREKEGTGGQVLTIRADDVTLGISATSATPVDLSGTIKTVDNTDICAMVLASGQFMFSCNPPGVFSLTDLPRENDGTVKRQIYADGFFPKIDILAGTSIENVVMTRSGACPSYNTPYDPGVFPDSAGNRVNISGKVLLQDTQTPICAMVLANGQYMFSCDGSGSYALNIPLDNNGQFKLQVYADGFAPAIQTFDEFSTVNVVRMARAAECQ